MACLYAQLIREIVLPSFGSKVEENNNPFKK